MATEETGHGVLISLCPEFSYAKCVVLLTFLWELGSPKAKSQRVMICCSFIAVPLKGGCVAGESLCFPHLMQGWPKYTSHPLHMSEAGMWDNGKKIHPHRQWSEACPWKCLWTLRGCLTPLSHSFLVFQTVLPNHQFSLSPEVSQG